MCDTPVNECPDSRRRALLTENPLQVPARPAVPKFQRFQPSSALVSWNPFLRRISCKSFGLHSYGNLWGAGRRHSACAPTKEAHERAGIPAGLLPIPKARERPNILVTPNTTGPESYIGSPR